MQRFFLYANPGKPETIQAVSDFADLLINKGCEVLLDGWLFDLLHKGKKTSPDQLDNNVQAVVCFGGDGTILRILPYLAARYIPVLGVNMGHTGFLLQVSPDELDGVLDRFIAQDYEIKERAMLSCEINGQATYLVMNEFALTRGQNPSSIVVDVQYENERVFTIHGDGYWYPRPQARQGIACLRAGLSSSWRALPYCGARLLAYYAPAANHPAANRRYPPACAGQSRCPPSNQHGWANCAGS